MNPVQVVAELGIDTRFPFWSTAVTPGNNTLELSISDHRADRIILSNKDEIFRLVIPWVIMGFKMFFHVLKICFAGRWSSTKHWLSLQLHSVCIALLVFVSPSFCSHCMGGYRKEWGLQRLLSNVTHKLCLLHRDSTPQYKKAAWVYSLHSISSWVLYPEYSSSCHKEKTSIVFSQSPSSPPRLRPRYRFAFFHFIREI